MINLEIIKSFYPPNLRNNALLIKYILKEYIQLMILDYLSTTSYIRKIRFIGGTSIRLIKRIDRFSEDLDFDCKIFSQDDFTNMTDDIAYFLRQSNLQVETKDAFNPKLKAFRRSFYFPEFLFGLGLSAHREERFLIKIESQDQKVNYEPKMVHIKGCGYYFPMPVPDDPILCAMKISAMLDRKKGRDFYDVMFLLSQTLPDFNFLKEKNGISNLTELKAQAKTVIKSVDLKSKRKDFEHLLFDKRNSSRILYIEAFFDGL